jgi:hypothetical protein
MRETPNIHNDINSVSTHLSGLGHAARAERVAADGATQKLHHVARERAGLVREDELDLTELLVERGGARLCVEGGSEKGWQRGE